MNSILIVGDEMNNCQELAKSKNYNNYRFYENLQE